MADKVLEYKVLSQIRYAARVWNAGEVVSMPESRAKKYLDAKQIEAIAPTKEK